MKYTNELRIIWKRALNELGKKINISLLIIFSIVIYLKTISIFLKAIRNILNNFKFFKTLKEKKKEFITKNVLSFIFFIIGLICFIKIFSNDYTIFFSILALIHFLIQIIKISYL